MESLWAYRLDGLYYTSINFNRGDGGYYTALGKDLSAAIPKDADGFDQWRSTLIQRLKSLPLFTFRSEVLTDEQDEVYEYRETGRWPFQELNITGDYIHPAGKRRCSKHPPSYFVTSGYHYTFDFDRNRWSVGHGHHLAAAHFCLDRVPDNWVQYVDQDEDGYTCLSPFAPIESRAEMTPKPRRVPEEVLKNYEASSFQLFEIPAEFEQGSELAAAAFDELRMKAFLRFCSVQQLQDSHFDPPVYKSGTRKIYSDGVVETGLMLLDFFGHSLEICLMKRPYCLDLHCPDIKNFNAMQSVFQSGWLFQEVFYVLAPHLNVPENLQWALVEAMNIAKKGMHRYPTTTSFKGIVFSIFHVIIVEIDTTFPREGKIVSFAEASGDPQQAGKPPTDRTFQLRHTPPIPLVVNTWTRSFHPAGSRALRYAFRRCSMDRFAPLKTGTRSTEPRDSVSRLPHEIQQLIFSNMSLLTLKQCTRVNRDWYHIALPLHDGPRIGPRYIQGLVARHAGGRAYAFLSFNPESGSEDPCTILILSPGVANHALWTDTLPEALQHPSLDEWSDSYGQMRGLLYAFEISEKEYYGSFRARLDGPLPPGVVNWANTKGSTRRLIPCQQI